MFEWFGPSDPELLQQKAKLEAWLDQHLDPAIDQRIRWFWQNYSDQ